MKFSIRPSNIKNTNINIQHVEATFLNRCSTPHVHPQIEFAIVTNGNCNYHVEDEIYNLKKGDSIFVNSHLEHSTEFLLAGSTIEIVYFLLSDFESTVLQKTAPAIWTLLKMTDMKVRMFHDGSIFEIVQKIIEEYNNQDIYYSHFIKSYIYTLVAIMYRKGVLNSPYTDVENSEILRIQPVLNYVNENYSKNISLETVSNIIGFNKSYFCRLFKKITGKSFFEYLNSLRVNKAIELIGTTDLNMLEISNSLGFSSPTYFAETFKRICKCTPSEFKKKIYKQVLI